MKAATLTLLIHTDPGILHRIRMDSSSCKYSYTRDVDTKMIHESYFGADADKQMLHDVVDFPIRALYNCTKLGLIKGNILIDFSYSNNLFQFIPLYNCFNDITILEVYDSCVKDMEEWVNYEADAYDWAHAADVLAKLEGCSNNWKEMENDLRGRVKHILRCDLKSENPTGPVILEKADCLVALLLLGAICKDLDDFCYNVKKLASMLKKGGCLLLIDVFNASYYTMNGVKHHILNINEEDLRKALKDGGLHIEHMETCERTSQSQTVMFERSFVVCAINENED